MGVKHRGGGIGSAQLPVKLTSSVPTNTIQVGDAVCIVSGFAVPVTDSSFWDTNEATTQAAVAAAFGGISNDRSRAGVTDERDLVIACYFEGEYEVPLIAAATLIVGDYLAPAKGAGNTLTQTYKKTAVAASGLFVCVEAGTSVSVIRAKLINSLLNP